MTDSHTAEFFSAQWQSVRKAMEAHAVLKVQPASRLSGGRLRQGTWAVACALRVRPCGRLARSRCLPGHRALFGRHLRWCDLRGLRVQQSVSWMLTRNRIYIRGHWDTACSLSLSPSLPLCLSFSLSLSFSLFLSLSRFLSFARFFFLSFFYFLFFSFPSLLFFSFLSFLFLFFLAFLSFFVFLSLSRSLLATPVQDAALPSVASEARRGLAAGFPTMVLFGRARSFFSVFLPCLSSQQRCRPLLHA